MMAPSGQARHSWSLWLLSIQKWLAIFFPLSVVTGRSLPDIVLGLSAGAFILYSAMEKDWKWLHFSWVRLLALFWGYMICRSFLTPHLKESLHTSLPWGRYIVFAAMLSTHVFSDTFVRRATVITLGSACLFLVGDTIIQAFVGYDIFGHPWFPGHRLTGPFRMPRVAITMVWILWVPLMVVLNYRYNRARKMIAGTWSRWVIGGLQIIFLCGLLSYYFIVGERTAFWLFLSGLFCFCLLSFNKRTLMLVFISGLLVLACLFRGHIENFIQNTCEGSISRLQVHAVTGPQNIDLGESGQVSQQNGIAPKVAGFVNQKETVLSNPYLQRSVLSTHDALSNLRAFPYMQLFVKAARLFKENLLFGIGPNQYFYYSKTAAAGPEAISSRHPHNFLLETLSSYGLCGSILFFAFFFYMLRRIVLRWQGLVRQPIALGLILTLGIRLIPVAGTASMYSSWSATIFWFLTGWLLHELHKPQDA